MIENIYTNRQTKSQTIREGLKKLGFLGDMFPKLWPPSPSAHLWKRKRKTKKISFFLYMYIYCIVISQTKGDNTEKLF